MRAFFGYDPLDDDLARPVSDPLVIDSLDLRGSDLRAVPKNLTVFRNVSELNLSLNQIRHLPVELGHLKKLRPLK